jgi:hypothetical protein
MRENFNSSSVLEINKRDDSDKILEGEKCYSDITQYITNVKIYESVETVTI